MTPELDCYPDCPTWEGDHRPGCPNELEALRNENSRLRQLLDEIHRGEATPPRAPKRYDEASQITVQTCQIPGCVRVAGHQNFHCTIEAISKRRDAAEREDA